MNSKKDKKILLKYGWIICVFLLLCFTFIGYTFFNKKADNNFSAQDDKLFTELFKQINENYQITIAPENVSTTLIDSINNEKSKRAKVLEDTIIKQIGDHLKSNSENFRSEIQSSYEIIFIWGAILSLLIILSIVWLSLYLKKQLNEIKKTNEDRSNTERAYLEYQRPLNPIETKNQESIDEVIRETEITDIEETRVDESTSTSNFAIDDNQPNIKKGTSTEETPIVTDYDEQLTIIVEGLDNQEKIQPLKELIKNIQEDENISIKQINTLSYKVSIVLAETYILNNNQSEAIEIYNNLIDKYPQEVITYIERAKEYKNTGQYDLALNDYDKALELDCNANKEDIYINKGLIHLLLSEYKSAIVEFDSALTLNSENPITLYYRGQAHSKINDLENALNDYTSAIRIRPEYEEAYNERGILYYSTNEFSKAIEDFDNAIRIAPNNYSYYNMRGLALTKTENIQRAIEDFSTALDLDPQNAILYKNRGNAFSKLSDFDNAIADYNEALLIDPSLTDLVLDKANAFFHIGAYTSALLDYDMAIEIAPDNTDIYLKRGISYYNTEKYQEAISDFNEVLKLESDNIDSLKFRAYAYMKINESDNAATDFNRLLLYGNADADIYFNLATIDFDKNEFKKAISNLDKSLELNNTNANALFIRGMAYSYLKEYDNAISDFDESLKLSPSNADVLYNRANAYANKQQYDIAINDYTEAISINPNIPEIYFNRANIYYNHNQYDNAINDYTEAIGRNEKYTKAYFNRGLAYKTTGYYQKGLDDFNKVISLEPNNQRLIEKSQKQVDILTKLLEKSQNEGNDNIEE